MEWLFRIGQDPKRLLGRYLDTNFSFVFYLMREGLKGKKGIDRRKPELSAQEAERQADIPRGIKGFHQGKVEWKLWWMNCLPEW